MNIQYHFQLVFLRLKLKKNVLSESTLRISLLQAKKQIEPSSNAFQTEQLKIKKNQTIIDLESIKIFHFDATKDHGSNGFTIKYEIKGHSQDRVRSIPINTLKMIQQFEKDQKNIFEESFGGQNAQISFKIYITSKQHDVQVFNLTVTPQNTGKQNEEKGNMTKRSNSISRSKRPPDLNISKRAISPTGNSSQAESNDLLAKPANFRHLSANAQNSLIAMSPVSPDANHLSFLTLKNDNVDENSSISGAQKKISSLPLSQIQKVQQLIKTHHRPQHEDHHEQKISYKLKIVLVMLVIGIAFLLYDTLSDRKIKRHAKAKESHNTHNTHEQDHKPKKKQSKKRSQKGKK